MTDEEIFSIDLEDTFFLHHHPTKSFRLKLSSSVLSIQSIHSNNSTTNEIIPIDDLYGCLSMKVHRNVNQCHLVLYLYALKRSKRLNGTLSNKGHLERSERIFTYGTFDDFQSNFTEVTRWHRAITQAMYLRRHLPCKEYFLFFDHYSHVYHLFIVVDIVTTKRDKPVLVFVNPAGGAGKAHRLVMEYVVGVWAQAEFSHHIIVTGRRKLNFDFD